jgi:hypothetical protein
MANPNWARWIHSSVAVFLKDVADDASLPILIEGIDERSDTFMEATDRVEVRVNGPSTSEISAGFYKIFVDVNCLFFSRMDGTAKNAYELERFLGIFHEAMDGNIPIFKFGNGPDDDPLVLVGCLSPRDGRNDAIRVIHFGQIDAVNRIREGMVDARYIMHLSG